MDAMSCSICGRELASTQLISGKTVTCEECGTANVESAVYCTECGKKMLVANASHTVVSVSATDGPYLRDDAELSLEHLDMPDDPGTAESLAVSTRHESLLAKLDRMERDLASINDEHLPSSAPDDDAEDLYLHEEALKNISYTLDSLISDLLEAEIREYTFPDFIHPDESGFPLKEKVHHVNPPEEPKRKNLQEILVIAALVAAIFLVGLSFGLWGAYFFGL
jgi:DNA-directed RNA polymerase subunit RPC12/RpoP